jgi:hypothetical protein
MLRPLARLVVAAPLAVVLAAAGPAPKSTSVAPQRASQPEPPTAAPPSDAGAPTGGPQKRRDVPAAFAAAACSRNAAATASQPAAPATPASLSQTAWSAGVFDAQIEVNRVTTRNGLPLPPARLERSGRALAQIRRYGSYATGTCKDGSAWIAAFPSPKPAKLAKNGDTLTLPIAALRSTCDSWRVDFAPAAGGRPRRLAPTGDHVALKGLGDGTVGVACQPLKPRWQGPVSWFLAPVGKGPASTPPEAAALSGQGSAGAQLAGWVNRVRAKEHLEPVVLSDELTRDISILTVQASLAHDRLLLKRVGDSLAARQQKLVGENRVQGRDAAAMAWLLWTSPRHRDLLLDGSANLLGVTERSVGSDTLAVMVLATGKPLASAKASTPKSRADAKKKRGG